MLGLSTVYGIVKQSDGNIEVTSQPDKETTFKILLLVITEKNGFTATQCPVTKYEFHAETICYHQSGTVNP